MEKKHSVMEQIIEKDAKQIPNSITLIGTYFRLLPVQVLMLAIVSVNDTIISLIASNFVGSEAMSAVGLYAPINQFFVALSGILVAGSQILCAEYMGRNAFDKSQRVFSWNLLSSFVASLAGAALLILFATTGLSKIFTSDPEVLKYLNPYILGRTIGLPAFIFGNQLAAFLSLENQTKRTAIASGTCVAVTTAAGFLFVAVLKMQALGLALAVSAGNWAYFLVQIGYFFREDSSLRFRLRPQGGRDWCDIIKTGYSGGLSTMLQALRGYIVNILIITFVGTVGISAMTAVNSFLGIFWTIPSGMAGVTRMLMSIAYGEEDRQSVTDIMRIVLYRCVLIMCFIAVLIILAAVPITRMFYRDTSDPVYQMTVMGFRLIPVAMPMVVISHNFICYGQITGKRGLVNALSLTDGLIGLVVYCAILLPIINMKGRYVADILNAATLCGIVVVYSWIVRKKFPGNLEDVMALQDDFGVGKEDRIDISVRNMEEVMTVSEQTIEFCRAHGIDQRRANYAGLFLEEMASMIVEHGFHQDKKPHSVDIRVVYKGKGGLQETDGDQEKDENQEKDGGWEPEDSEILLRIKDNCKPLNPKERADMIDQCEEDTLNNMGLRVIYNKAKDVQYQNMLGMNVLTIRI